jgi:1-acyl-sn-glycerol-3-phosphate acyltransferase
MRLSVRKIILQKWSAHLLHLFNVKIHFIQHDDSIFNYHGLIVTNHISWLDVFVLNAIVPMRFVAKSEVRSWPVIGWLCDRVQTIFIERGSGRSAARINTQLVELFKSGESIAVFPEGTTTDGASVAHFHSSLIQPAIDAGAKVYPMAIRYHDAEGKHSTVPAYIDDVSFAASLWSILTTPELHVKLVATQGIDASGAERRTLTRTSENVISTILNSLHVEYSGEVRLSTEPTQAELDAQLHFQSLYGVLLNPPLSTNSMRRETI